MTDLHTHILPRMDDGAKDSQMSLDMLHAEYDQGVRTVVLTPHFYRDREEPERFLNRRAACYARLQERIAALPSQEQAALPQLILGAEVAWAPNLSEWEVLPQLRIGQTNHFLLELPFTPWNERLLSEIYEIMGRTGLTPVIAHLERYMKLQRSEHLEALLSMGLPVQVSAEPLLHPLRRGQCLKMIRSGQAQFMASDAHNLTSRTPNLAAGLAVVEKKLGKDTVAAMVAYANTLAGVN